MNRFFTAAKPLEAMLRLSNALCFVGEDVSEMRASWREPVLTEYKEESTAVIHDVSVALK
jgi:hypothetical protein